jgi:hypothetical protein
MKSNFNSFPLRIQQEILQGLEQLNANSSKTDETKDVIFTLDGKEYKFHARLIKSAGEGKEYVFDFLFE